MLKVYTYRYNMLSDIFGFSDCKDFSPLVHFERGPNCSAKISRAIDAVSYKNLAYFRGYREDIVHRYNANTSKWSKLPECPVKDTTLVILPVRGTETGYALHTIGGLDKKSLRVGDLYCLKERSKDKIEFYWGNSAFPPLREKRKQVTAVTYRNCLIAAGGRKEKEKDKEGPTSTIEVLDLTPGPRQWFFVASLPQPVFRASGCICGDSLYVLGGYILADDNRNFKSWKYAFRAPLPTLLKSHASDTKTVFQNIAGLRLYDSTCTTFCNKIFAVGGSKDDSGEAKSINHLYVYQPVDDYWKKIKWTLMENRSDCFVVSLTHPNPQLVVVGGYTSRPDEGCTNTVEIILDAPLCNVLESSKGVSGSCESEGKSEEVSISFICIQKL